MDTDSITTAPDGDDEARTYVRLWQHRAAALDVERLRELRALSEVEAAQRFARLLCLPLPYPQRETSGLVEQQRLFARLRDGRK